MKIIKWISLLLCLLLLIGTLPFSAIAEYGTDLEINALHFPDENFRAYLQNLSYASGNSSTGYRFTQSALQRITAINVANKDISDLKGIEYFTNLKWLYCYSCKLTSLDVSQNTQLKYLDCNSNELTSLNVISCADLETLNCTNNKLSSVYVTYNTALKDFLLCE